MGRRRTGRIVVAVAGSLVAVVVLAAGALVFAAGRRTAQPAGPAASANASATATERPAPPAAPATPAPDATPSGSPTSETIEPTISPTGPSLDAYRGLASWVDIYDAKAWNDPAATVSDMGSHGVRTLFIETGNSSSKTAIFKPDAQQAFIREAHAHGMRIVAWYLPELLHPSVDYDRVAQAIGYRTTDGQSFDSFALDIESGALKPVGARNKALEDLSLSIRALAGPAYPLGAIIPSPVGISRKNGYWPAFPYGMLARTYDVFVPMSYYTYHGKGGPAAYADTIANVRIIRAQPGCSTIPIHLIGGIAEASSPYEVAAFVRAARETGCIGAGLYGWTGTGPRHWQELKSIVPTSAAAPF
jgi:hypothetical protein